MKNKYLALFLDEVKDFIGKLPDNDQGKISASVAAMETGNLEPLYIKTLKTPIKELIIKNYRFVFFIHDREIYFVGAFVKKTAKTPKKEIEKAQKVYKLILEDDK